MYSRVRPLLPLQFIPQGFWYSANGFNRSINILGTVFTSWFSEQSCHKFLDVFVIVEHKETLYIQMLKELCECVPSILLDDKCHRRLYPIAWTNL